jgi:hypothetical protein
MLAMFEDAGVHNSNNIKWQFWQQHNKPILLQNQEMALRALNCLHNNLVVLLKSLSIGYIAVLWIIMVERDCLMFFYCFSLSSAAQVPYAQRLGCILARNRGPEM